jgi:hypothetical protein
VSQERCTPGCPKSYIHQTIKCNYKKDKMTQIMQQHFGKVKRKIVLEGVTDVDHSGKTRSTPSRYFETEAEDNETKI